jgi:tetratricopeptide (TPR) repeat protein
MGPRRAFAALFVCLVPFAQFASAQAGPPISSGSTVPATVIRGSLRLASDHTGVEGIRIELKQITGETLSVAYTTSNGNFEFLGVPGGTYVLEVAEKGYEPLRESVEVRHTSRTGLVLFLRDTAGKEGAASAMPAVPARELTLSKPAADLLRKGRHELFARSNPKASLKHFQKLAAEAPDFFEAHYYLGLAYIHSGRLQEAETELWAAIAGGEESHAPSYVTLASLLTNQQRFAEAEPLARKAIALEPDPWPGHFELARSLFGLNRIADAYQSARTALEKKKDSPDLHLLLAELCIRRKDAPGLLTALDAYLALQPEGPMSNQVRATRKKLLENMEKARAGQAPAKQPPPQ